MALRGSGRPRGRGPASPIDYDRADVRHARRRIPVAAGPFHRCGAGRRGGRAGRGRPRPPVGRVRSPGGLRGGGPRPRLGRGPGRRRGRRAGAPGEAGDRRALRRRRTRGCARDGAHHEQRAPRPGRRRLPGRRDPRAGRHAALGRGRPGRVRRRPTRAAGRHPGCPPRLARDHGRRRPGSGRRRAVRRAVSEPPLRPRRWARELATDRGRAGGAGDRARRRRRDRPPSHPGRGRDLGRQLRRLDPGSGPGSRRDRPVGEPGRTEPGAGARSHRPARRGGAHHRRGARRGAGAPRPPGDRRTKCRAGALSSARRDPRATRPRGADRGHDHGHEHEGAHRPDADPLLAPLRRHAQGPGSRAGPGAGRRGVDRGRRRATLSRRDGGPLVLQRGPRPDGDRRCRRPPARDARRLLELRRLRHGARPSSWPTGWRRWRPMEGASVFFGSGGSDAVDTAAKLARRYWDALGHTREADRRQPRARLPRHARLRDGPGRDPGDAGGLRRPDRRRHDPGLGPRRRGAGAPLQGARARRSPPSSASRSSAPAG